MTVDPTHLLKQLEPAVRPAYASAATVRATPPLEHQPFDELLARAGQGLVESGRVVSAAFGPAEELSREQLARLSAAADLAEAAGAKRALLLMDGRGLVLDVPDRTLSGELDASHRVVGLEAAFYVPGEGDASRDAPLGPPSGVAPREVGEHLEQAQDQPPSTGKAA